MKLIVGLGNPGDRYINTRHNVGFCFLDYYISKRRIDILWKEKFDGLYGVYYLDGEKIIFLKPQTYMNLSGNCVKKYVNYFNISLDDILIISDDLDLFIGNFKLKSNGSSGGHNGLDNIFNNIGSNFLKRLKVGISDDSILVNTKSFVLGNFTDEEKKNLLLLFDKLCFVLDDFFIMSFSDLMNKYNQKNR